jgi:hypothetical protein
MLSDPVWRNGHSMVVADVEFFVTLDLAELHGHMSLARHFLLGKNRPMIDAIVALREQVRKGGAEMPREDFDLGDHTLTRDGWFKPALSPGSRKHQESCLSAQRVPQIPQRRAQRICATEVRSVEGAAVVDFPG